jgi:hypothetical protein
MLSSESTTTTFEPADLRMGAANPPQTTSPRTS